MRLIPTSLPPCTFTPPSLLLPPWWYPSSPPLLPEPLSGSLDSVSSHIKRAWRSPRRQDPGTATSARGETRGCMCVCECEWGAPASEGGRWWAGGGHRATSRCHRDPNSRLGGRRGGKRDGTRDPPLQPSLGREERGDQPESLQTLHLCSPLLSSPCKPSSPRLLPLLTVQLGN